MPGFFLSGGALCDPRLAQRKLSASPHRKGQELSWARLLARSSRKSSPIAGGFCRARFAVVAAIEAQRRIAKRSIYKSAMMRGARVSVDIWPEVFAAHAHPLRRYGIRKLQAAEELDLPLART